MNFYARKEIKDLLSYLRAIDNPRDDVAVHRIINVPKRGIGAATIAKLDAYAAVNDISFSEALDRSRDIPGIGKSAIKTGKFAALMNKLRKEAGTVTVRELLDTIIEETEYVEELRREGTEEAKDRIQNIDELINKIVTYEENTPEATLASFLQEVSLVADIDSLDGQAGKVLLMTLHSAKGLEFPVVYMTGMEEGLFPSSMALFGERPDEGIEEERRLCYVGITRARRKLTLTSARMRMNRGERDIHKVSRFIDEIPKELLDERELEPDSYGSAFGSRQGYAAGRGGGFAGRNYGRSAGDGEYGSGSYRGGNYGGGSYGSGNFGSGNYGAGSSESGAGRSFGAGGSGNRGGKPKGNGLFGKPLQLSKGAPQKADHLDYEVGDRVTHVKFGEGTVKELVDVGRDYQVSVEFDKAGLRKMMAAFAKLEKKK